MRELVRNGKKIVYIISCANDSLVCPACKKLSGKRFKISEVPELPYEQCTSEMGCRCDVADFRVEDL
jgi:hypothetical protein